MSEGGKKGTRLDWALRYIKLGWAVMPLRGKVPLTEHGSKDATLNEAQARAWWTKWPDANIGIATEHKFFMFDVDVKNGGEDSYDFLRNQHGNFPNTIQAMSGGGGKHLLFRTPDFIVKNSDSWLAPGIDIRGSGGYMVAMPSIHPETKRRYVWDGLKEIEEEEIAEAPAWLLDKLRSQGNTNIAGVKATPIANTIGEGGRNSAMFKLACSLRRKGLAAAEILATLRASNEIRCVPPLDQAELQTIANSSERYVPDARGNLFQGVKRDQTPDPPADPETLPLTAADIEAAIDALIEKNDLAAAIRMAPDVAKLAPIDQAVIKAKLKNGFKDFPVSDFAKLLKSNVVSIDGSDALGQNPPNPPGGENGDGSIDGPDLRYQPLTDAGNGERMVALFGKDIRYCIEMKSWLVWDGKRWAIDAANEMRQKGKRMARLLYLQAIGSPSLSKHARDSESYAAISNALGQAATEPGIPISVAELDKRPMLLNCPSGVLDLATGKLLPHDRDFMITKLCPIEYHPEAKCPRFQTFVEWAMGGNVEAELTERTVRLVGFLQRAIGCALTGDVRDRVLFVFHGGGKNGKTTFLTVFRDLLGKDYSCQIMMETLMTAKTQDSTARADLADLRGMRFVMTSEVEKEHKLKEGQLKMLTAGIGAPVKARRLYENPYEFPATHKIFMDCNDRPKVRGSDEGIWDRLKLVPFDVRVNEEQKDKQLPDKLRTELPGILAWAVRGCLAWKEQGLGDPPEVSSAGLLWREHDDPLKEFIDDCCRRDDPENDVVGLFVRATDLSAGYEWWAKQNRERYPLGREAFTERLQAKGFTQNRSRRIDGKQARTWEGIELLPEVNSAIRRRDTSMWQSDET